MGVVTQLHLAKLPFGSATSQERTHVFVREFPVSNRDIYGNAANGLWTQVEEANRGPLVNECKKGGFGPVYAVSGGDLQISVSGFANWCFVFGEEPRLRLLCFRL